MTRSRIYLDYAAATPLDARVAKAMRPYFESRFGNSSSVHAEGRRAKTALDAARREIADVLGCSTDELIFTSGATESVNLAIFGLVEAAPATHRHIVSVATEHKAALRAFEESGYEVTYVPVDSQGLFTVEDVLKAVRPDTALVSVMYANNEIGTIAPISEIGLAIQKLRQHNKQTYPLFHTDAAAAANYLALNVEALHVDALSLSAAKIYGPKGSGLIYVRRNLPLRPRLWGGAQEGGRRAGTENVAAIVGLARALSLAQKELVNVNKKLRPLRDALIDGILTAIPGAKVNGSREARVSGNVNISLPSVDAEAVIMYLDERGISASTASSCASSSSTSHVIKALGCNDAEVAGSIRFTLGRDTTMRQIKKVLRELPRIVLLLRIT